jgi:hypothetical protein
MSAVFAEWNGSTYRANVDPYGVATVSSDAKPVERVDVEPHPHELDRYLDDGGAVR